AGGDYRTEHAEGVEALGARPLREARIPGDDLDGGDIVDAGVAEDAALRIGFGDRAAALADDDAELAFVHDLAGIGLRRTNRFAAGALQPADRLFASTDNFCTTNTSASSTRPIASLI